MPVATAIPRSSGLLLHPTSLPGPYGVGDLGPEAFAWVDDMARARQSYWQILPLNPPGGGESPYTALSAFAGNVALLSPDALAADGLVDRHHLLHSQAAADRADFEWAGPFKRALVREAWDRCRAGHGPAGLRAEFDAYRTREAGWLDDFALFAAARDSFGGAGLHHWPADLRRRRPTAMATARTRLAAEADTHRFGQFLFDRQWQALRTYAAGKGVRLIGDAPIFVSPDSADVWANPDQFLYGPDGEPTAVAGVPPDYFSETGQLWGNPLYDWDRMAADGYRWWVARLRRLFAQVDVVRLDHFRGFAASWHVPAGETTALRGAWVPGPGRELFDAATAELGPLPLIAEDLGLITDDVHELRLGLGYPGMRVLHFALGGPDHPYWPHNYDTNTVAYTGTHDNDTSAGWYAKLNGHDRYVLGEYLGSMPDGAAWELMRLAWASVAVLAVAPLQDVIGLGSEARMNVPGVGAGNWRWRLRPGQFAGTVVDRLAGLTARYNRIPGVKTA